ncbi:MAG TPA: class I SAM-dependent methyltransferase [Actinocatenispora sp.]
MDATERFLGDLTGQYVMVMLDLGRRVGLLDALRAGPGTAAEIATRAGAYPRAADEWLRLLTAAGYVRHEGGVFAFADGMAELFDPARSPLDVDVWLRMGPLAGRIMPELATSVRDGRGVPYAAYEPDFTEMQDRIGQAGYDRSLLTEWVPAVPGLADRLAAGARVADLGTGGGYALCLLAGAFPASTFTGFDIDAEGVALGTRRARDRGLGNVTFARRDLTDAPDGEYDVVLAIDTVHDLPDPARTLRGVRDALRPDGLLVLVEPTGTGDVDVDTAAPGAVLRYFSSLFHCMQVSLAAGGAGLGNGWPTDDALDTLRRAGYVPAEPVFAPSGLTLFPARPA